MSSNIFWSKLPFFQYLSKMNQYHKQFEFLLLKNLKCFSKNFHFYDCNQKLLFLTTYLIEDFLESVLSGLFSSSKFLLRGLL